VSDRAEVAVEIALLSQATAFAAAQSLTIALPNIKFTQPDPSPTAAWLRATFLPADSFTLSIAPGVNQHYGLFQIDVFYGQEKGEIAAMRIAAEAAAYFKFGTVLTRDGVNVQIIDTPKIRQSLRDDPWIMIPVRIPYKAFAENPA
jgi:uncharacterized protein DUF4128